MDEPLERPADPQIFSTAHRLLREAYAGGPFWTFPKSARLEILESLIKKTKLDYALLEIKKSSAAVDFTKVADEALQIENTIEAPNSVLENASHNLAFLDRATQLIAANKDTHFALRAVNHPVPVLLPYSLFLAGDNKVYISGVINKLNKLLVHESGQDSFDRIEVGSELVSIDGQDPLEAAKKLQAYVSASSEGYQKRRAVSALAARSFQYPQKGYAILEVKVSKGSGDTEVIKIKSPWFMRSDSRADIMALASQRKYRITDDLKLEWDPLKYEWKVNSIEGDKYDFGSQWKLDNENSYDDADGEIALRSGIIVRDGSAYGVLQLFTFSVAEVFDGNKKKSDFNQTIRNVVSEFKEKNIPLILDLRSNGGGIGSYPSLVLSSLTPKETKYRSKSMAFRVTPHIRQSIDSRINEFKTSGELIETISEEELAELLGEAVGNGDRHTAAFSSFKEIEADDTVGGYDLPIVTLISPYCISACDVMSMILKWNNRATLIGTHTNGTGAGYLSSDEYSTSFKDNYQVIRTMVPNYLFGSPHAGPENIFPGKAMELNSENKPTVADIEYKTSREDLTSDDSGWKKTAIDELQKQMIEYRAKKSAAGTEAAKTK